jgi:hypothetical protein
MYIYLHYFFIGDAAGSKWTEGYLREFQKFQQIGRARLVESKIRQSGHVFKRN